MVKLINPQEDNKNIRVKSEESFERVREKEILCKEVQDRLTRSEQQMHMDQIKVWKLSFVLGYRKRSPNEFSHTFKNYPAKYL